MHRHGIAVSPMSRTPSEVPGSVFLDAKQATPCRDACASHRFVDDSGPGTRTLRRCRHDLGLDVRNDRYSVLRSRVASGAKARTRS